MDNYKNNAEWPISSTTSKTLKQVQNNMELLFKGFVFRKAVSMCVYLYYIKCMIIPMIVGKYLFK